ncbi:MAG: DMT family transporter [Syntrophaceae bacterium]|nr:DMT family transporter [Syntrophaceae bacterium]
MKKSLFELHFAVAIMSTAGIFAKLIILPARDIIALRCLVATVALVAFTRFSRTPLRIASWRDRAWIALIGLIVTVHWVAYFTSVKFSTVTIALVAVYTYPVITALLEPLFSREPLDRHGLRMALIVFGGVYLAVPGGFQGGQYALGAGLGVLSAVLYSFRNLIYRRFLAHLPPSTVMTYQVAIPALLLSPSLLSQGIDVTVEYRWLYLLLLGVVVTALAHTLYSSSLRTIKASTAGMISSLEPIYGMALAAILLSEMPAGQTVAGTLIVVAVAVYMSLRVNRDTG